MSTITNLVQRVDEPEIFEPTPAESEVSSCAEQEEWGSDHLCREQTRLLVRQLFFSGSRPPRQVVFSAVDESTYVAEICMDVAKGLAAQVSGSVCVIEANSLNPELESIF